MFMLPMRSMVLSKSYPWNIEWLKCFRWAASVITVGWVSRRCSDAATRKPAVPQAGSTISSVGVGAVIATMSWAAETFQATLSETEYGALVALAESPDALSGRRVASALGVSPTTANEALRTLAEAGFATSEKAGRARLWRLDVSHPSISDWLGEVMPPTTPSASTSSPYSTGGGGVRLEHSYAACLLAGMLAGEALPELGDSLTVDSIRLQASDVSEVDDILVEGRDAQGVVRRASIAVRRSPTLTRSDSASVPLFRDFLTVVIDQWSTVAAGQWRLVLAVSTNANAITQLAELAELARSVPSGEELARRVAQRGRTSAPVRDRYEHLEHLVVQAAEGLDVRIRADGAGTNVARSVQSCRSHAPP
jgi:biotin operon repressor